MRLDQSGCLTELTVRHALATGGVGFFHSFATRIVSGRNGDKSWRVDDVEIGEQ